mgnify:CR=1 FL=1
MKANPIKQVVTVLFGIVQVCWIGWFFLRAAIAYAEREGIDPAHLRIDLLVIDPFQDLGLDLGDVVVDDRLGRP